VAHEFVVANLRDRNVVDTVLAAPILQAGQVSDYKIELCNKDNQLILPRL
jgi:hypothetical protein